MIRRAWGVLDGRRRRISQLRFPPNPHLRSSRFSRHPRFPQSPTKMLKFAWFLWAGPWSAGPQTLGARAPSPLETGPQHPGPPLSPVCCISNPWVRAAITPNPLTLGGVGWFPKAELYSPMRGGFAPAFQPLGRAPRVWGPGQQAPEPCIPAT